jgi:hypothetical protein
VIVVKTFILIFLTAIPLMVRAKAIECAPNWCNLATVPGFTGQSVTPGAGQTVTYRMLPAAGQCSSSETAVALAATGPMGLLVCAQVVASPH